MKSTYTLFLLTFVFATLRSQVGINTSTPNPSSVLDINSTTKGVLLPKYDLQSLNSLLLPVLNPVDGMIIYNEGGTSVYPKGYYIWIKTRWERAIIGGTEPQSMTLYKIRFNYNTDPQIILIPTNSTNNALDAFSVASNRIDNASLGSDQSTITLPPGTYIIKYSVDSTMPSGSATQYFSRTAVCTRSYLVNTTNNQPLTEFNRMCQLSNAFTFFQGTFYLTLTSTTSLKQHFEFDTGNGLTNNPLLVRSSFNLNITKMGQ